MRSWIRLGIALLVVLLGLLGYCSHAGENPVTGEKQNIPLSIQQEIALGMQAQTQLMAQYGGLHPDKLLQQYVEQVGQRIVSRSIATKSQYPFAFHLLNDVHTVNAFALPGGQVFFTVALLKRLDSEAQLAAVLGHAVGHVVARHGAEHLAKKPGQSLAAALTTSASDRASSVQSSEQNAAIVSQAINQLLNLRYTRDDEIESDRLGLRFMTEAGYDPQGIVRLMQMLNEPHKSGHPIEFFSTHPSPDNRVKRLQTLITQTYPQGTPRNLKNNREAFAEIVQTRL